MKNKVFLIAVFILVALVQLSIPAKMIFDSEIILKTGTEYKFITEPVDPNDPFRGKYISLSFANNSIVVENGDDWLRGEMVYALLEKDSEGFAKITGVLKQDTQPKQDYLKMKVNYVFENEMILNFPFDRFYMEESKSQEAEDTYIKSMQDSANQVTYALVSIKNGEAVLKDVQIDGVPIMELLKSNREKKD